MAVISLDDATAEAAFADKEPCAVRGGRERDRAGQGVVAWRQVQPPDVLAFLGSEGGGGKRYTSRH
jgi:hypothetical protein